MADFGYSITYTNERQINSMVNVTCFGGALLVTPVGSFPAPNLRTCTVAGWDPPASDLELNCVDVKCDFLDVRDDLNISCSGDAGPPLYSQGSYLERCNFTCNSAEFSLVGARSISCRSNSAWTSSQPFCSVFDITKSFARFDPVGSQPTEVLVGSEMAMVFNVRDSGGQSVGSGLDLPLAYLVEPEEEPEITRIASSIYSSADETYRVKVGVPTRSGEYTYVLGVNSLLFPPSSTGVKVSNFTLTALPDKPSGPSCTLQTVIPGEDGVIDVRTNTPFTLEIALFDQFGNTPIVMVDQDDLEIGYRLGFGELTGLGVKTLTVDTLTFDILIPSSGRYGLVVELFGEPMAGSPFFVEASSVCVPGEVVQDAISCDCCSVGSFSEVVAAESCELCPDFTTSSACSPSWRNCTCLPTTWFGPGERVKGAPCVPCPLGGECAGGMAPPVAAPGFEVAEDVNDGSLFVACPRPSSCLGRGACAPGYTGRLCTSCVASYYRTGPTTCEPCPSSSKGLLVLFFVLFVGVAFVMVVAGLAYHVQVKSVEITDAIGLRSRKVPGTLGMSLTAFQIVAMIADGRFSWSDTSQAVLSVFSVFNFDVKLFAAECSYGDGRTAAFFIEYVAFLVAPLLMVVVVVILLFILRGLSPFFSIIPSFSIVRSTETVILGMTPVAYIPLARATLSLFDCTRLPGGGPLRLDTDPSIPCGNSTWWAFFPVGLLGTGVYVMGIPLGVLYVLRKHRRTLFDPHTFARFGILYRLFTHRAYWGEVGNLGRRLCIVVAAVFLSQRQILQIALLVITLLSSLVFLLTKRPYYYPLYNQVDAALTTLLTALAFFGGASHAERSQSASTTTTVFVVLIVVSIVIIAAVGITMDIREIIRERRGSINIAAQRQAKLVAILEREALDITPSGQRGIASLHQSLLTYDEWDDVGRDGGDADELISMTDL